MKLDVWYKNTFHSSVVPCALFLSCQSRAAAVCPAWSAEPQPTVSLPPPDLRPHFPIATEAMPVSPPPRPSTTPGKKKVQAYRIDFFINIITKITKRISRREII